MPAESAKGQRVPEKQRRRAAVSCDYCKHRRAKCIRTSVQEPCTNCLANRLKCESTLPRKQRVYGSVESLSIRYRALEALIRGLFEDENTGDLDTLYRIAEEKHISMPPRDDLSPAPELFAATTPGKSSISASAAGSVPYDAAHHESDGPQNTDLREKLIPTAHGVAHYVGPSSSFRFVTSIRSLVAQCHNVTNFSQKALRADFVDLRTSKALEIQEPVNQGEDGQKDLGDPSHTSPSASAHTPLDLSVQSGFANDGAQSQGFLPPRDTADSFVRVFFNQVHPNYPVFHRGTFQLQYESLWQPRRDSCNGLTGLHPVRADTGYLCCLAMVFVFGAQALSQHHNAAQAAAIQERYLDFVRSSLGRLIGTTSMVNVQALLLLQLFEHNSGQRNASWMFLGSAARMAVALGMHRENAESADFDTVERDTRRRVWATLYTFERNLCVILGRPSAIDDAEVTVSMPTESMTEAPRGFAEQQVNLTKLTWRIKRTIYSTHQNGDIIPSVAVARALLADLEGWYASLPAHLLPDWRSMIEHHRRAVLLLHAQYKHAVTLVLRPYLLHQAEMDLSLTSRRQDRTRMHEKDLTTLRQACIDSTEKSLQYLTKLADDNLLNGVSWIDVYYLYHCTLVLCLELLANSGSSDSSTSSTIYDQHKLAKLKERVKSALRIAQQTQLSPTYRVLMLVARQFAGVVGAVGPSLGETNPVAERGDNGYAIMTNLAAEVEAPGNLHLQQPWIQEWLMPGVAGSQCDSFDMGAYATPFSLTLNDTQYMEPVDMLPVDLFRP